MHDDGEGSLHKKCQHQTFQQKCLKESIFGVRLDRKTSKTKHKAIYYYTFSEGTQAYCVTLNAGGELYQESLNDHLDVFLVHESSKGKFRVLKEFSL